MLWWTSTHRKHFERAQWTRRWIKEINQSVGAREQEKLGEERRVRERVEEATVQSGGEPLSELIWSGAGGSSCSRVDCGGEGGGEKKKRRRKGRGKKALPPSSFSFYAPTCVSLPLLLLPLAAGCAAAAVERCRLLFSAAAVFCWLCSPIGCRTVRWAGFWGSSASHWKTRNRSRLPLAAATATVNVFFFLFLFFSFLFERERESASKPQKRSDATRGDTGVHARTHASVPIHESYHICWRHTNFKRFRLFSQALAAALNEIPADHVVLIATKEIYAHCALLCRICRLVPR